MSGFVQPVACSGFLWPDGPRKPVAQRNRHRTGPGRHRPTATSATSNELHWVGVMLVMLVIGFWWFQRNDKWSQIISNLKITVFTFKIRRGVWFLFGNRK